MLNQTDLRVIHEFANEKKLDTAGLMAVCEVESGGNIFAVYKGRKEPLIRFEGHYFYRLLGRAKRNKAVVSGLAAPKAGAVTNPYRQSSRWKLLGRACLLDKNAALQSTSWGIGQVMGAHWQWLDYSSVDDLVQKTRSGLDGQLDLMVRYIQKAGLAKVMAEQNWKAFARGYNGPSYGKNKYDKKLAIAYRKYCAFGYGRVIAKSSGRHWTLNLRFGDFGELVRDLQKKLIGHGYNLTVDGDFGPVTLGAVKAFQASAGLVVDGIVGPNTFIGLERNAIN